MPLLLVLMTLVLGFRRVPLSVGYARTFANVGPILFLACMIAYGGYAIRQARFEARAISDIEALVHNEARWLAGALGERWPVRIRETRRQPNALPR